MYVYTITFSFEDPHSGGIFFTTGLATFHGILKDPNSLCMVRHIAAAKFEKKGKHVTKISKA